MKILVLNCGSSSVKFQVLEMDDETLILKGIVEKIGSVRAVLTWQAEGKHKISDVREIPDHDYAIRLILETLTHPDHGVLKEMSELAAVGHRVVHGGEEFSDSVLIDDRVLEAVDHCSQFAPLHNPANLKGIQVCRRLIPDTPQVGVFDTAFHNRMPARAYLYGLPLDVYRKLGVRRYGFHGTSHKYVAGKAAELLGKPLSETNLITCHLGNGASIAAIENGISVDTTMGFTPLEGLVMGTRCGDIDPAIIPYLMETEKMSPKEVDALMNKRSGLLGLTETTNDVREILAEVERGSEEHITALEVFTYRVRKYIGSYSAALGRVDAVVFTGGIGENAAEVRERIVGGLEILNIHLDQDANRTNEQNISNPGLPVLIIPTNEELAIAQDTRRLLLETGEQKKEDSDTRTVVMEMNEITSHQKAQLVLLWASNQQDSLDKITQKFNFRFNSEYSVEAVRLMLDQLGLLEGKEA